ncbi:MAG: arylesterase [Thiotrichaceae bacterium]
MLNLENAVGSQKSTQAIGAPSKTEKLLTTNKVTTNFSVSLSTPLSHASFLRSTALSRLKKIVALFASVSRACAVSILSFLLLSSVHAATEEDKPVKILVWGDSLSAAYGIPVEKGWVSLLENKLGKRVAITNASISGETTQGGLTRLPDALNKHSPDMMLLELGANDGLRGIRSAVMRKNLNAMISLAKQQDITVILLGMKIPPNYGLSYTRKFEAVFSDLAEKYQLGFVPFILKDIATDYDLMQADGLHPNSKAQPLLLNNILPVLEDKLLQKGVI